MSLIEIKLSENISSLFYGFEALQLKALHIFEHSYFRVESKKKYKTLPELSYVSDEDREFIYLAQHPLPKGGTP